MHRRSRAAGFWVFAVTLSLYLATAGGSMATDPMTYEVTRSIVEARSVAMSYNVHNMEAHRGIDGRYYAPYGLGQALYNIPFYLAGRALERWTGLDARKPEAVRKAVVVLGNTVAAAAAVWVTFLFARAIGASPLAAVRTALALGFATLLWPYAKFGFNAPLATLCLVAGIYAGWLATQQGRTGALVASGVGIGSALLVRHELALGAIPILVVLWRSHHGSWESLLRRVLIFAAPIAVAVAVTLIYNDVRFGNPLDTGYLRDETATYTWPVPGIAGLLFSPGRSLFLYAPVTAAGVAALAGLWRRNRRLTVLCAGQVLVLLSFYASLTYWDADRSYGPRYLVPALPFFVLPLAFWFEYGGPGRRAGRARRALPTLVVLSVLVQLPGVLVDFSKVGYTPAIGYHPLEERRWRWELAGLTLNARAAMAALPGNWGYLTGARPVPVVRPAARESRDFSDQFAFSLDFWWLYLFYLGAVRAPVAVGLGLATFVLAGTCGWQLRRTLVADRLAGDRPMPGEAAAIGTLGPRTSSP